MKKYLFYVSLTYAYSIMRPLQKEIRRRGDEVAWFIERGCADMLSDDELRLTTLREIKEWNPIAVFAPGNWICDLFPGVKVQLFHGYPINKRGDKVDNHFRLRGWFDMYCTQGSTSTEEFKRLEAKHGYFKVYETGWSKADEYFSDAVSRGDRHSKVPTIFVASTFSKGISSLEEFLPLIKELLKKRDWHWFITMHPKLLGTPLQKQYEELARENENVVFRPVLSGAKEISQTDAMLCDSSSIILEYMFLDKPVVTYRNTSPGKHLINVTSLQDVESALDEALTRPQELMQALREYAHGHESHSDGKNCSRILDAVDDFIENEAHKMKRKPLNLVRKLKLRWKLRYIFH